MSDFDTALKMAIKAHEGQLDKGGLPYILHPLHVASFFTGDLKIIAILHDVVEDSYLTIADLKRASFSQRILNGVQSLTRSKSESYEKYITRVSKNPDAVKVKLQDLKHNSDIMRLEQVDEGCWAHLMRYHSAYRFLSSV